MGPQSIADLRRAFVHFAEICERQAPIYADLARRVAADPEILAFAEGASPEQPAPNLLMGAVHFLLLGGRRHPLAAFYPSVDARGVHERKRSSLAAERWDAFTDFCTRHRPEIIDLVASRRVQTNEVGRCGMLLPAFSLAYRLGGKPLHLIEVGSSAGLNLGFDRYRYIYNDGQSCGPDSSVVVRVEFRGPARLAIPAAPPPVASRLGVDIEPQHVLNVDAMRWLEALIWPDELDRIHRFRAAVSLARIQPPRMVAGDALQLLRGLVADADPHVLPCIFHSHAVYQMDNDWRAAFGRQLEALGRQRDLAHISLEWLGSDSAPQLRLALWRDRKDTRIHLAECDHHGRWIKALDVPGPEK